MRKLTIKEAPVTTVSRNIETGTDSRKVAYQDFQKFLTTLGRAIPTNVKLDGTVDRGRDSDIYEIIIKDRYNNRELDSINLEYRFGDNEFWSITIFYTDKYGKNHFLERDVMDLDSLRNTIKKHIDLVVSDKMNESFRLNKRKQMNEAISELNKRVRAWYLKTFPDDKAGADIDKTLTWKKLRYAINNGWGSEIYKVIGAEDSVIRGRVFEGLADVLGITFDNVYDAWETNKPYRTPDHITL